jgi:RES domain-containing protein
MLVYRIAKEEYIHDFSGAGAKRYGGRWNRPGMAVLYTSQARSLALLELLVHFSTLQALGQHYYYAVLEVPDTQIVTLDETSLPRDILRYNHEVLWAISDQLFQEENRLAVRVPSVLIPEEYNILLNPEHTDYDQISCLAIEDAIIDTRYIALFGQ